jgi:hypothetical protein
MRRCFTLLLFCFGLATSLWGGAVRYGMTRAEVEEVLGHPSAVLAQGSRLVLLYPKNGRIELEKGVAIQIFNLPVDIGIPLAPPPSPTPPEKASAAKPLPEPTPAPKTTVDPEIEVPRLDSQRSLEADVHRVAAEQRAAALAVSPTRAKFWSGLLVAFVFRVLVTVIVLKLAFAWSDAHADWVQMFLPAIADSVTQAVIGATAFTLWSTNHLLHLDQAISYFVLLGVLLKTTHACTLPRAIAVAGAAKLASIVLWAFLSVMILQLLV